LAFAAVVRRSLKSSSFLNAFIVLVSFHTVIGDGVLTTAPPPAGKGQSGRSDPRKRKPPWGGFPDSTP
jgi:hypothetical protein